MKGGLLLAIALIVGMAVGGAAGYWGAERFADITSTITNTTTSTVISTVVSQTTTTGATQIDLQAALNNTVKPDLLITSYSFGKSTLTVWVLNNGTEPFVITPHVPLLNDSTDAVSSVISLDADVVHLGSYLYVPPGGTIIVTLDAPTFYMVGQIGVLAIYGDSWTFAYGTQKG